MSRVLLLLVFIVCSAQAYAGVTIDGHISPGEWKGARHITDFRQTQPLTGKPARLRTEAWILPTKSGLAIAFRNVQPPDVPRTRQHVQRDFEAQVDRDNLIVDFDADGRTGYNFTVASTGGVYDAVITGQNNFNKDWDGQWKHAASVDADGWTVEMLIPWYTAPMQSGHDGKRTIGIYLDRVVGSTGERFAWPEASFERTRFLSDFRHIEVPAYSQSLLAITPYVSGLYDNVDRHSELRKGADIFWKPNGQFQMTATLNPDFGEVESDDLVVNFGATETYFSDKRPFFTENQGIFDFSLLDDNSQLVYTRRVGGPADDGSGSSDIRAAVKLNGSVDDTSYGVLAADEAGLAGRTFGALRVTHDFGAHTTGLLLTRVQHPWLDRQATVLGVDDHWQPNARVTAWTNLVGSDIVQQGTPSRGFGLTEFVNYEMDHGWRQQWLAMHFDDRLQVNDFGYLGRNSLDYVHWEVRKRVTDLPADSMYRSHDWRVRIGVLDNDHGLRLRRQFRILRESQLSDGGTEQLLLNVNSADWNDLLTRGNGALFLPPSFQADYERSSPRHGDWAYDATLEVSSGGLAGNRRVGYSGEFKPTYFLSDAFSLYAGLVAEYTPDWLVWQRDAIIGRFRERSLELDSGMQWIRGRHELRVKLQALGLDARLEGAYRVDARGRAVASSESVNDFNVRNLGLQVRYRYRLAPLSYLTLVYARGGYAQDAYAESTPGLLRNSFALRNDEQLLMKISYRFDI